MPSAATNKRIFVQLVTKRIGIDDPLAVGEPYDDVSWHDYFRVVVKAATHLQGPDRLYEGLREVGRWFYPDIAPTTVGRLMLGRHLGDAIRQAAETWQQFNTVGRVRAEFLSDRQFRYHFEDYPVLLTESIGIGIFEGMFRHHHMPVVILVARISPMHTVLDICW